MSTSLLNATRVLARNERYSSEIQYRDYNFPDAVGFTAEDMGTDITMRLAEKTWSESGNILCYLDICDGRLKGKKVLLSVSQNKHGHPERDYMPIKSNLNMLGVPLGTKMSIRLGQGSKYIVWLNATIILENQCA